MKPIILSLMGVAAMSVLVSQKDKTSVNSTNFFVLDSNKHTICSVYVSPIGQVNISSQKQRLAYLSKTKDSTGIVMGFNLKPGIHNYQFNSMNSYSEVAVVRTGKKTALRSAYPSMSMAAPMTTRSEDGDKSMIESKIGVYSEPMMDSDEAAVKAKSGVVTAGLWSDLENWDKYFTTYPNTHGFWGLDFTKKRFSVEILNPDKTPAIGVTLILKKASGESIWQTQTDNRGYAELWSGIYSSDKIDEKESYQLFEKRAENYRPLGKLRETGFARSTFFLNTAKTSPKKVDICFTVDATGSMGDEINYLKEDMMQIIQSLKKSSPCTEIRVGSVFYRDKGDEYVTRKFDFSTYAENALMFIGDQSAGGGGDFPEAVEEGLRVSNEELNWSIEAVAKINFLILDAPPHANEQEKIQEQIRIAALKGIKIIPITASGIDASTEILMKQMAIVTNGEYLYITDHSGVGGAHLKPTGVKENVDLLTNQVIKVLKKFCLTPDCNPDQEPNNPQQDPNYVNFGSKDVIIQCYPNPASEFLDFEGNNIINEISMRAFNGQEILNIKPLNKKYRLKLPIVKPGIYVVTVNINQRYFNTKIVIQPTNGQGKLD
jgi:hypothetical protein